MSQQQPLSRQDFLAILIGFGLVISVVVFFAVKGSSSEEPETVIVSGVADEAKAELPTIAPAEAMKKLSTKTPAKVVDIRSEIEYQARHVTDSIPVPAERLSEYFPAQKEEEIIIVPSEDENVSAKASEILSGKNIRHAFIDGGIIAWEQIGGPIVSFGNPSSPIDRSKVTFVSVDAFRKAAEDQDTLHAIIDVRSKEAFVKSHVPEAMNIPLSELERRRAEIPPATNIALYAETQFDAFQAAVRLFDFGMFSVKTLEVGFPEWESKEMPVVKSAK